MVGRSVPVSVLVGLVVAWLLLGVVLLHVASMAFFVVAEVIVVVHKVFSYGLLRPGFFPTLLRVPLFSPISLASSTSRLVATPAPGLGVLVPVEVVVSAVVTPVRLEFPGPGSVLVLVLVV